MAYKELKAFLDTEGVTLVAVSKTKPISSIQELYNQGHRVFGENRVQELVEKYNELAKDIQWHMIGTLQKNKVKYIAPFVSMIHSVDSLDLAKTVNKYALKSDRQIDVLLQVKIAKETSKFGFDWEELRASIGPLSELQSIRIRGLMGMGTFTADEQTTRDEFQYLKRCFEEFKNQHSHKNSFDTLSMGMSGDYKLAVEEGSTMVRIGSLLFGGRY